MALGDDASGLAAGRGVPASGSRMVDRPEYTNGFGISTYSGFNSKMLEWTTPTLSANELSWRELVVPRYRRPELLDRGQVIDQRRRG